MWDMFNNSLRLFVKGKLFREPGAVFRRWLIGFGASLAAFVVFVKLGVPLWIAVTVVALGAGGLQPYLFKHLKYA
jgi:hypothetical protein